MLLAKQSERDAINMKGKPADSLEGRLSEMAGDLYKRGRSAAGYKRRVQFLDTLWEKADTLWEKASH